MVLAKMKIAVAVAFLLASAALDAQPTLAADSRTPDIKTTWSGTLDQFSRDMKDTVPVRLTVEAVSGDEFTGTMEWPTFNGCKTRVQGTVDGKLIKWIETAYLKGDDVVLGGLYVARFKADNEISGDWMDPKHTIDPKGPKYGVPGASFTLKKE